MCSTCSLKIRRAALLFREADRKATREDPIKAFYAAPTLAGQCAQKAGLAVSPTHWDFSGRNAVLAQVMSLGWMGNDADGALLGMQIHQAIESAHPAH
jgi:hypothetical protein